MDHLRKQAECDLNNMAAFLKRKAANDRLGEDLFPSFDLFLSFSFLSLKTLFYIQEGSGDNWEKLFLYYEVFKVFSLLLYVSSICLPKEL